MAKTSRSKKSRKQDPPSSAADILAQQEPARPPEKQQPDDFQHVEPTRDDGTPMSIPWPPPAPAPAMPPASNITVIKDPPPQVMDTPTSIPRDLPTAPLTEQSPGKTLILKLNPTTLIDLRNIVAYRIDRSENVVLHGADGVKYVANGAFAQAIRKAIGA